MEELEPPHGKDIGNWHQTHTYTHTDKHTDRHTDTHTDTHTHTDRHSHEPHTAESLLYFWLFLSMFFVNRIGLEVK